MICSSPTFFISCFLALLISSALTPVSNAQTNQPEKHETLKAPAKQILIGPECSEVANPNAVVDGATGCQIYELSTGDFCRQQKDTKYAFDGHELYAPSGKRIFKSDLQELVLLVENSRRYPTLNFAALGVTPEAYEEHKAGLRVNHEAPSKTFSYSEYCALVTNAVRGPSWSTSHMHVRLSIPAGSAGNKEDIEVSSEHMVPLMLPWKVKVGNSTWTTYYPALPAKLSTLLDRDTESKCVLDDGDYWTSPVWHTMGLTR